jgi:hypothetical protein
VLASPLATYSCPRTTATEPPEPPSSTRHRTAPDRASKAASVPWATRVRVGSSVRNWRVGQLSVWRALGGSVDVAWFSIWQAWRWTPGLLPRLVLTSLVVAITPAAQVLVVANLVRAADLGQLSAVVPPLVILVLLVAASQLASEWSVVTIQRLYLALSRRYLDVLLQAVTRLSPQQLARLRCRRGSRVPGNLSRTRPAWSTR